MLIIVIRIAPSCSNGDECRRDGMDEQRQEQAIAKLDRVLKLVAMMAVKGLSQTDQIATLNRIGFSPKDIAEIVGTTSNTVRVTLVSIRRTGSRKGRGPMSAKKERQHG
jgi:DNA-directed RNA polymerase specialized sigma24 family protein